MGDDLITTNGHAKPPAVSRVGVIDMREPPEITGDVDAAVNETIWQHYLDSKNEALTPAQRTYARECFLDRMIGKPVQQVKVGGRISLVDEALSQQTVGRLNELSRKALEGNGASP